MKTKRKETPVPAIPQGIMLTKLMFLRIEEGAQVQGISVKLPSGAQGYIDVFGKVTWDR